MFLFLSRPKQTEEKRALSWWCFGKKEKERIPNWAFAEIFVGVVQAWRRGTEWKGFFFSRLTGELGPVSRAEHGSSRVSGPVNQRKGRGAEAKKSLCVSKKQGAPEKGGCLWAF